MRRLLRRAFTFAAAVSALLFVAVCVLWVRSHWVADRITVYHVANAHGLEDEYTVDSRTGRIWIGRVRNLPNWGGSPETRWSSLSMDSAGGDDPRADFEEAYRQLNQSPPSQVLGFSVWACDVAPAGWDLRLECLSIEVPYWALAVLSLLLPAIPALRSLTARGLSRRTLCQHGGDDLRAAGDTPDTPERCPERGTGGTVSLGKSAET